MLKCAPTNYLREDKFMSYSVFKAKGRNRWTAQVDYGIDPVSGNRDRECVYADSKKEAEKKAINLLFHNNKKPMIESKDYTLKEWLRQWLLGRKSALAYKSYKGYESNIKHHIIPALGDINIRNLKTRQIQNLINYKFEDGRLDGEGGLSRRSVKYIYQTLNAALRQAYKERIIDYNPVEAVELPKKSKQKSKVISTLSSKQVSIFLKTAKNHSKLYIAFLIAFNTGLRKGELLALQWSDLNYEKKELDINKQHQRIKGKGIQVTELKSSSSYRTIPVNNELLKALNTHKHKQKKNKLFYGGDYIDDNLIICKSNGQGITPEFIYEDFKHILKKGDLPDIRFHDVRHTFATLSLQVGIQPHVVADILGHGSVKITLDTYSHVTSSMYYDAADKIASVIGT